MIRLENINNMTLFFEQHVDVIYADYMYQDTDFDWIDKFWYWLKPDSGIFIAQTDDSSIAEVKMKLDSMPGAKKINICIYKQEWGGKPKKGFPNKHDYILIYANGDNWKWYEGRIQIPKKTLSPNFNPSGRVTKTPCSVWDDLGNFSTVSKERVKFDNGKNLPYQKPLKLFDRLLSPFTDEGDFVLDLFAGSGSVGVWCQNNNRNYIGVEYNTEVYNIAKKRLGLSQ